MWMLALVSHALAGGGRPPAFEALPVTVPATATEFCTASGQRVTVLPDGHDDLVSVTTIIGTGAAGDPAGAGGAHALVQRLSFRAQLPTGRTVVERLAELGATSIYEEDLDTTSVVTLANSALLSEVLAVERARVSDPLAGITSKQLEAERNAEAVRLDDIGSHDLVPMARYLHAAFQDAPYAQLGVATRSTLGSLDLDTLRAVAATAYRRDRTMVVVRGDVDPEVVARAFVERVPVDEPTVPCAVPAAPPAPKTAPRAQAIGVFEAPVAERTLVLGWVLPPAYRGDDVVMDQAVNALLGAIGRGLGSTTAQIHKFQPACGRLAGIQASLAICSLRVPAGTSARSVERRALSQLLAELATVDSAFDTETTARFKVDSLNLVPVNMERLVGGAPVAWFEHATGDWDYFAHAVKELGAFDGRRVVALAKTWMKPDLAHTVLLHPPGTSGDPDAGAAAGSDDADAASGAMALDEPGAASVDAPIRLEDESLALLADQGVGAPQWLGETVVTVLENGLRVVVVPWGSAPLTRVALVLAGGDASEPLFGLDALTERITDSRASAPFGSSALTLDDAAQRIGGAWSLETTHDARVYRLRVGAGQLDAAAYLLQRRIDGLDVDLTGDERYAQTRILADDIDWYGDDPNETLWWAIRTWRIALWGPTHPNARMRFEAAWWAFQTARPEDPRQWHHERLRPDRATLYIVGDVDPAEAERIVRARMGEWKRPKAAIPPLVAKAPASVPERRVYVADTPESRIAVIAAGCPVAPSNRAVRQVVAVLMNEALVDRLTLDLAIAGSDLADVSDVVGGAARVSLSVTAAPERAAAALRAIDSLFVELSSPLPIERVQRAQARALRAQVTHWVTGHDLLEDLVSVGGPTGDLSAFRSMGEELRAVGPADVAAFFESCSAHRVAVVTGPGITRADLGPAVLVIDREDEHSALRNRKASAVTPAPDLTRW